MRSSGIGVFCHAPPEFVFAFAGAGVYCCTVYALSSPQTDYMHPQILSFGLQVSTSRRILHYSSLYLGKLVTPIIRTFVHLVGTIV